MLRENRQIHWIWQKLRDIIYARYVLVSVFALAMDIAVFTAFLWAGTNATWAAIIGYSTGIIVHWLGSSRFVFTDNDHIAKKDMREKILFLLSALLGLALTAAIVKLGEILAIWPHIAKLFAIIISFQITYIIRKYCVFKG